jgi:hypothetical protein
VVQETSIPFLHQNRSHSRSHYGQAGHHVFVVASQSETIGRGNKQIERKEKKTKRNIITELAERTESL